MYLAHPASGITTAYVTRKIWDKKEFTSKQRAFLYSLAIFASSLPDFDLMYALINNFADHRKFITHTPFLYVMISIIALIISFLLRNKQRRLVQSGIFIFFTSTMLHMITDIFAARMRFFYPLSKMELTFLRVNPLIQIQNVIIQYLTTPHLVAIECFFIVNGLYILFAKLRGDKKVFLPTLLTLSILSIIAISIMIFFIFTL